MDKNKKTGKYLFKTISKWEREVSKAVALHAASGE
jgi:hypothetical protein